MSLKIKWDGHLQHVPVARNPQPTTFRWMSGKKRMTTNTYSMKLLSWTYFAVYVTTRIHWATLACDVDNHKTRRQLLKWLNF